MFGIERYIDAEGNLKELAVKYRTATEDELRSLVTDADFDLKLNRLMYFEGELYVANIESKHDTEI